MRHLVDLQIAILLSSVASLLKKKSVWVIGLALGLVELSYFVNGFFASGAGLVLIKGAIFR